MKTTTDAPTRWKAIKTNSVAVEHISEFGNRRVVTFGNADQRKNFLRTLQSEIRNYKPKKRLGPPRYKGL
jgi:hypothetical protein